MKLEISNCSFSYPFRDKIFENFSLAFEKFPVVILGPNGAGKSTLVSLISTKISPQKGIISFGDYGDSTLKNRKLLRKNVSQLPQQVSGVSGLSVFELVSYSAWLKGLTPSEAKESAVTAIKRVGLEKQLKQNSKKLSGGQQRRMGIAQALASKPKVLILDEPYAGLDPEHRQTVRLVLQEVAQETPLIVTTHQTEDLASIYESVVVIDDGQCIFQGAVTKFLSHAPEAVDESQKAEQAYIEILAANR